MELVSVIMHNQGKQMNLRARGTIYGGQSGVIYTEQNTCEKHNATVKQSLHK